MLFVFTLFLQFVAVLATYDTQLANITADGVHIFYRTAGNPAAPTLLLLHGFPASSFQFRNLIPLLADRYHLVAPDLPGFGFTVVPNDRNYNYTFASLATTMEAFVDALEIKEYAIYLFDFGATVGFRMATNRPSQITAAISQNGNAYLDGLGQSFWSPIETYWNSSDHFNATSPQAVAVVPLFDFDAVKSQYTTGVPAESLDRIDPASYTLDAALLKRPGQQVIQLSYFYDYQSNVALYPTWQAYLREYKPRLLAMWGENDIAFLKNGALDYKKDDPNTEVVLVNTGHFALETNLYDFAIKIDEFLSVLL
ncbi:alpha/beta hydrolase fold protein [Ramaria rubella]|nr:alpha/beta hydrolase fold protein [Ramaria rubella]